MFVTTKMVHLLAVSVFLGSLVTVLVAKLNAEKIVQDGASLSRMLSVLLAVDAAVTGPSAAVLTISGVMLIAQMGWHVVGAIWLQMLVLFWIASAFIAHFVLLPNLRALAELAMHGSATTSYQQKSRGFTMLGTVLVCVQVFIFLLAILRP